MRSNVVVVLALFVAGCSCEIAPKRSESSKEQPVVDSSSERIYVSNETAGTVSVIDAVQDRVIARISVGKRPRGLRVSPDGKRLFVALSGSPRGGPNVDESKLPPPDRSADGIGVVDLATLRLERVLTSGPDPECFDLTPDGRRVLVSNEDAARASLLDVASGKPISTVVIGEEPEGVAVHPDGKIGYVTSESDHRVEAVDLSSSKLVRSIPTGKRPRSVLFTRDGAIAYVSAELGKAVNVIDARKHEAVATIEIAGPEPVLPMGLALSADERTLFVTTGRGGSVAVIDAGARRTLRTIDAVGKRPWGIALSRDGTKLYTANGPSNDVSVIDAESGNVIRRIPSAGSPWGVAAAR